MRPPGGGGSGGIQPDYEIAAARIDPIQCQIIRPTFTGFLASGLAIKCYRVLSIFKQFGSKMVANQLAALFVAIAQANGANVTTLRKA